MRGSKDDSWLLVSVKDVQVHFLLEEYRYELDLEFRWLNKPPEPMINKWKMYQSLKKKSVHMHYDEETFESKTDTKTEEQ